MSDVPSRNWTWDISNVSDMNERELRMLLQNRKCRRMDGNKRILLMRLKHNFLIDDKDLKPFNQLKKFALICELKLRHLSTQEASMSVLLDRFTVYEIPPIEVLLVTGYCREGQIEYKIHNFPDYLAAIVASYWKANAIGFYLSGDFAFTADFIKKSKGKYEIIGDKISFNNDALLNASMSIIPQSIQTAATKWQYSTKYVDQMVFSVDAAGGTSAMVINNLNADKTLNVKLPDVTGNEPGINYRHLHFMVYEPEHKVIYAYTSILYHDFTRRQNHIFETLSLDTPTPQWTQRNIDHDLTYYVLSAGVIIKTNDHKKKIFAAGSFSCLYDLNEDKWTNKKRMHHSVNRPGILFENHTKKVYVGCGLMPLGLFNDAASQRVQCYDINTEKWSRLPFTNLEHWDAKIWSDNVNLLVIGSTYQDGVEFLDLRDNKGRWKCAGIPNHNQSLSSVFGVDLNDSYSRSMRLCML